MALTGHGVEYPDETDKDKSESFFCPADVRKPQNRLENLVSLKTIYQKLEKSQADVKILVVDACREKKGDKGDAEDFEPPNPPKGIAAFYSCKSNQKSFEYDKDSPNQSRHGLFIHRFLEGLNGAGALDGKITLESLSAHVKSRVPVDAKNVISPKANQDPHVIIETVGTEVVLARVNAVVANSFVGTRAGQELMQDENGLKLQLVLVPAGGFHDGQPR